MQPPQTPGNGPPFDSPFAKWAIRDVSFVVAHTDTPVDHEFKGIDPEEIRWMPIQIEGDANLYQGIGSRKAANDTTMWLRASAVCRARVLIFTEHP